MPKKCNHTKSRKITFTAIKRKRIVGAAFRIGRIKRDRFIRLMTMPLKKWMTLKHKGA